MMARGCDLLMTGTPLSIWRTHHGFPPPLVIHWPWSDFLPGFWTGYLFAAGASDD